jgi:hypothetical protein
MGTRLPAVQARAAADIVPHVEGFTPESAALLRAEHAPGDFLDALAIAGKFPDAVRFLAHGLGRREAVWWACVCVRLAMEPAPPPPVVAALTAAETWCYRPTEENRRAAFDAGEAAKFQHPAALAALGAFLSGGSLAPPNVQPVPPGPFLTARTVAGAIMLAAVRIEPAKANDRYRAFLAKGVEIANAPAQQQARGGA